jgi:hypothetical protein
MYTRVRLAWYYRPSDVSDRPVADSRLLLAAIYSEICDVAQLRSKCYVVHRDKITDLAGWKKRPDRFYFNRLFDPYIKKEFEVIQSNDVRNRAYAPDPSVPGELIMCPYWVGSAHAHSRSSHLTLRICGGREGDCAGLN